MKKNNLSDQSRVRKCEDIIRQYEDYVRSIAYRLAPAHGAGDDIAQQVFIEFYEHRHRWDFDRDMKPLLAGITRNIAKRYWRQKCLRMSKEVLLLAQYIEKVNQEEKDTLVMEEERNALRHCLERLPEKSRELVEQRYYIGIKAVEIAGIRDMTAAAVRNLLKRIRQKLRDCMRRYLENGDKS